MSNVIKRFIQLAKVIIGVNFLPRCIYFELIHEFVSGRISYYDMMCSIDIAMGNIISLFMSFVGTHASNTHKLNVSVAPLT